VAGAIEPALATDPTVMRALARLERNQAATLGNARVVGEFNQVARRFQLDRTGPLGRDYSIKMVWAPDRKRALFAGANHGGPHRLNDVWEFDLGALTWVLLYPPDNPRSYSGLGPDASDVRFENGVLITNRGGPAVIGHTWWGITYDLPNRRLLFMNSWVTDQDAAVRQLGRDPADLYRGTPLWSFDPQRKQWDLLRTPKPYPRAPFGGMLEFIPDLGGAIWHTNHWMMLATWLYRPQTGQWENLHTNAATKDFASASPKTEQVGYYDPTRKIVVSQCAFETFHLDVTTRQWSKVSSRPEREQAWANGHDAFAPMYFDPVSRHGLLVDFRTNALWSYDPASGRWAQLVPEGPLMPTGRKRLAYFDIEHGVLVVIDGTVVWAYRYSRR
jgi:hypothetical protein